MEMTNNLQYYKYSWLVLTHCTHRTTSMYGVINTKCSAFITKFYEHP